MVPLLMEVEAIQALLELQGSRNPLQICENDISVILAAKALLDIRASANRTQKNYENQSSGPTPKRIKVENVNQTRVKLQSPNPSQRSPLTEIQCDGTFVEAITQKMDTRGHDMSAGPSAIGSKTSMATRLRRTRRRKRTQTSSTDSSDNSIDAMSPAIQLKTPKACGKNMIRLGEGYATVPKDVLTTIKWESYKNATRKLLTAVFPRKILATHSLTGKQSPAFPNKAAKQQLDSKLVDDIVKTVVAKCGVPENLVRITITTKCADESKMLRHRQRKENQGYEE